jgi:hypothetical protein
MRSIIVNSNIEHAVRVFYSSFLDKNKEKIQASLSDLIEKYTGAQGYLEKLYEDIDGIVISNPTEISSLIDEFNELLTYEDFEDGFHKDVTEALLFDKIKKNKGFLKLYQTLNIKSCVYCNALLSVVVDVEYYKTRREGRYEVGDVKKRKAYFDVDHAYPKSKYPFLAISFFNLYPSCANCNRRKSNNETEFKLFIENGDNIDNYEFLLTKESKDKYLVSKDYSVLDFEFHRKDGNENNHNSEFLIDKIYQTQKDIIEELAIKSELYSESYKNELTKSFSSLFSDTSIINRLLIGNYDKPEDIHKRPLSKFTQDIAKDLKLI